MISRSVKYLRNCSKHASTFRNTTQPNISISVLLWLSNRQKYNSVFNQSFMQTVSISHVDWIHIIKKKCLFLSLISIPKHFIPPKSIIMSRNILQSCNTSTTKRITDTLKCNCVGVNPQLGGRISVEKLKQENLNIHLFLFKCNVSFESQQERTQKKKKLLFTRL